jgi:hypothetical protein
VQLYSYFVSQSNEFCRHNTLCRFSTSVYCCLFRYRFNPGTFGYILVFIFPRHWTLQNYWSRNSVFKYPKNLSIISIVNHEHAMVFSTFSVHQLIILKALHSHSRDDTVQLREVDREPYFQCRTGTEWQTTECWASPTSTPPPNSPSCYKLTFRGAFFISRINSRGIKENFTSGPQLYEVIRHNKFFL